MHDGEEMWTRATPCMVGSSRFRRSKATLGAAHAPVGRIEQQANICELSRRRTVPKDVRNMLSRSVKSTKEALSFLPTFYRGIGVTM